LTPAYAQAHPDVRDELRAMLAASSPQAYAACCGAIERMDLREALPRIAAPTLVVSGSDDAATPVEQQRLIAQSVPAARHEIVGPAAHIAAVEQADAVNRLIEAHLS
jgi:3-oxoadipate enol-lactonase